ncbi:four-carbon acid sugar kinase family protein [Alkalicoccobacillus gibsonii]|uniref:four-carbon acid sugar kinase family protein n=1 Tax=Alkalicoccobacillus gibsonii TaxID=79881 RepID=UPI0019331E33|nr:four-carbon acid sugar kinase family protein [Alkalicoccobacillus gibsonii]MBM0066001.1 hydroxyacid dehydrogenase [Alkalicoccobacillus gibsonii]
MQNLKASERLDQIPSINREVVQDLLSKELANSAYKIVVLDDDPTGIQTVHGVSVYTDWTKSSIQAGFREENRIFFLLTNSRGFTSAETTKAHTEIAERVQAVSEEENVPYVLISRGDSTLRGHYPLETVTLKDSIEAASSSRFDGEVIIPFFKEGGRLTIDNVHYVQYGDDLVPAGETEFAKDRTFSFHSSHLGEWVEEKTKGEFKKEDCIYITLETLRANDVEAVKNQLLAATDFQKIIVNAVDYVDVEVFVTAFLQALKEGKQFLCRSASALTKVIGGVTDKALLTRDELITEDTNHGGLIVVGSHVQKTTEQLNDLIASGLVEAIEFDVHLVLDDDAFAKEIERVRTTIEQLITSGKSVVYYTRRERLDLGDNRQEEELQLSVKISDAVTSIVSDLTVQPNYIVAKGGITSSSVGTTGLSVKRAEVAGQIKPGIPVWKTGPESKFPGCAYIVFPGNVGQAETLKEAVAVLEGK